MLPANTPIHADGSPITTGAFQQWVGRAVGAMRGAAQSAIAEPPRMTTLSVWYSGLLLDPTEFSQQLSQLQLSLQNAGTPARTHEKTPTRQ